MKLLIVLSVLLIGCDNSPNHHSDRGIAEHSFISNEGLECIYILNDYKGGVSCNWEKFNKVNAKKQASNLKWYQTWRKME